MLVEIYSEAFKKDASTPWGPISLRPGLNTVIGGDVSDNNIGKSSFLLAIDFCFGGETYPKKEVLTIIGHHTVYWTLKFGDQVYRFKRLTDMKDKVYVCGDTYDVCEPFPWSIEEYREFLFKKYGLKWQGIGWSEITSVFSRIDPKSNTSNYRKPLKQFDGYSDADSITDLERMFCLYEKIQREKDNLRERQQDGTALSKAEGRKVISIITEADYQKNLARIKELTNQLQAWGYEEIQKQNEEEADNDEALAQIIAALKAARSERYGLFLRRTALSEMDVNQNAAFIERDLQRLNAFLRNAIDEEAVTRVQRFHQRISEILTDEMTSELADINQRIEELNGIIAELSKRSIALQKPAGVSRQYVDEIAKAKAEILRLEDINETYLRRKEIKDHLKTAKEDLKTVEPAVLKQIQDSINEKLRSFFLKMFTNERRISPTIAIPSRSKYEYLTVDDGSFGSKQRDMVLFDLALCQLVGIPIIIHDNNHTKNIEEPTIEKLIPIYVECAPQKQFFLALDGVAKFESEDLRASIEKVSVLTLSKTSGIYLYGKDLRVGVEE